MLHVGFRLIIVLIRLHKHRCMIIKSFTFKECKIATVNEETLDKEVVDDLPSFMGQGNSTTVLSI